MTGWRLFAAAVALLFVVAVMQGAVAPRIGILGATPDFPVIVVSCLALVSGRSAGAFIGFAAGLVTGSLTMTSLAAFAVSRTVAGFVSGWAPRLLLPRLWVTGPVVTLGAVLTADLVFLLISPQTDLSHWVRLALTRAAYSAVLSVPLYVLVIRASGGAHARTTV